MKILVQTGDPLINVRTDYNFIHGDSKNNFILSDAGALPIEAIPPSSPFPYGFPIRFEGLVGFPQSFPISF